ncbi:hypothetical protein HZA86_01750 [Candidatus Uhrbacteria bacterium]|nr:hypothetical protein [Candidatus Uhrbacteria bacterium]
MNMRQGLALDIDETLAKTTHYWVERLQLEIGNPEGLSVDEAVRKYHLAEFVPYWQSEQAIALMVEMAGSNEVQEGLPLIESADTWALKVHAVIPIVAYITMRPTSVMSGTHRWLRSNRFPDAPVFARPESIEFSQAPHWKGNLVHTLFPTVLGLVDDRPSVVEAFPSDYQGTIFCMGKRLHHAMISA